MGGIYDQPVGLLERMATALNVYRAFDMWGERKPGHEKEWKEQNPKAWETVQEVNKMRSDG